MADSIFTDGSHICNALGFVDNTIGYVKGDAMYEYVKYICTFVALSSWIYKLFENDYGRLTENDQALGGIRIGRTGRIIRSDNLRYMRRGAPSKIHRYDKLIRSRSLPASL